ncbi:BON domain-containing protein [Vibrio sp. SM6]|uniref:BON domain-containing protein n=1 Tax=Vibrio agarilyticus TaxID=2726741 RepID=A0A7X8YG48_9VIBR|nr:BON domain-containing protein [Vibrio agarilyticus]NLS12309.1 BON domain-containing protein [Vibrio agarilyticus]
MLRWLGIAIALFHLTGCAGLMFAGAATTVNYVTDPRSTEQIWLDKNIEFEVAAMGNKAPYKDKIRLLASSFNGQVVMIGQIPTTANGQAIERAIRELKGVKSVHNRTQQKPPLDLATISEDTWITAKVKSRLLTENELNGIKVRVFTEDGQVFLFGYVTRAQGDKATEVARHISGVKEVIRAFQYPDTQVQ